MDVKEQFRPTTMTFPIVVVGTVLGSLVCTSNMYFGLSIGTLNLMSTPVALLAYMVFHSALPRQKFTPTENVVVLAIASSIASMPIAASLWSVVPSFEKLREPDEGGRRTFTMFQLITWSFGVSLFGIAFSAPLRPFFLLKQQLAFPTASATGMLVKLLHNDGRLANLDTNVCHHSHTSPREVDAPLITSSGSSQLDDSSEYERFRYTDKLAIMLKAAVGTTAYIVISYFVPVVNKIPVFGVSAAQDRLWYITLSPAFTAFGVILDLPIATSMMLGAIFGWGILAPIAETHDWTPGLIDDIENGARGWLIWVSIGFLLGDTMMRVLIDVTRFLQRATQSSPRREESLNSLHESDERTSHLSSSEHLDQAPMAQATETSQSSQVIDPLKPQNFDIRYVYLLTSSILLCMFCTYMVFGQETRLHFIFISVALAFPLCLIVIQSTGETDTPPANGLSNASQIVIGLVLSQPERTRLASMVLGAVTEAGLWQSAVLMSDLKTAQVVHANPRVIFYAQFTGSLIGAFIGSGIYRLFTTVYQMPNHFFPIPYAYMWTNTARLVYGTGGLPDGVALCTSITFFLSAFLRVSRYMVKDRRWAQWIPNGTAMSIGLIVPPSITLAKLTGAILRVYCAHSLEVSELSLISAATGCILTEGILGFIPFMLSVLGILRFSSP